MLTAFRLLWRRRRWRHGQPALRRPLAWLACMVLLFVAAMAALEDMPPADSLWLAVVTLTTVGYGDVFAKTGAGRIATVLLLLVGGVFVVAKVASDWFEWREEVRARKRGGAWRWGMEGHVLVVGTPEGDAVRFYRGLVRQLRGTPGYREAPVLLLTRAFVGRAEGLPASLCAEDLVHVEGAPTDEDALRMADAGRASAVIVLAERTDDAVSDAVSADVVARVLAMAEGARPVVVAECVDDRKPRASPRLGRRRRGPPLARLSRDAGPRAGRAGRRKAARGPLLLRGERAVPRRPAAALARAMVEGGDAAGGAWPRHRHRLSPAGRGGAAQPAGTEEIEADAIYVILREEREAEVKALAALLAGA